MNRGLHPPVEITVKREQVLAFRLQGHHLAHRLPPGALLEAAAGCGIQNTPPGSAELAFHARVVGLAPGDLDHVVREKGLLQTWAMRASPYFFPTSDVPIFTAGLLPDDEEAMHDFIRGASEHLERFGLSASEMVHRTAAALPDVLSGRELTKDELGIELARKVAGTLDPSLLTLWNAPDGMTHYGESLVRFALSIVALQGLFCIAPRSGNTTTFILTGEWLGSALPSLDQAEAQAEVLRRFLGCYGPSTPADFARWAGIAPAQALRLWKDSEAELAGVDFDGKVRWIHRADLSRLQAPPGAEGVRFLPPHDPYQMQPDHTTLIPQRELHPQVWRPVGNPGMVLLDGECAALWRPQKKGKRLGLRVTPICEIPPRRREEIVAEAETLAPFRSCSEVDVIFLSA